VNGFETGEATTKAREQKHDHIVQAIEHYDSLLEVCRAILEKQDSWLEKASDIEGLSTTDQMLEAINTQIAAAEEMEKRMVVREEQSDSSTCWQTVSWKAV